MFGMLDYRAHKLYYLLTTPFYFVVWITNTFIFPIASFLFVASYFKISIENILIQLIASIIALEIFSFPWLAIAKFILAIPTTIFNFLVDPVPAEGRSKDEAKAVVQFGDKAILLQKMNQSPLNWSDDDIEELIKFGFFQKIFYSEKIRERLYFLKRYCQEHPDAQINEYTSKQILKDNGLSVGLIEFAVTNAFVRNMLLRYIVILVVWYFWNQHAIADFLK